MPCTRRRRRAPQRRHRGLLKIHRFEGSEGLGASAQKRAEADSARAAAEVGAAAERHRGQVRGLESELSARKAQVHELRSDLQVALFSPCNPIPYTPHSTQMSPLGVFFAAVTRERCSLLVHTARWLVICMAA